MGDAFMALHCARRDVPETCNLPLRVFNELEHRDPERPNAMEAGY